MIPTKIFTSGEIYKIYLSTTTMIPLIEFIRIIQIRSSQKIIDVLLNEKEEKYFNLPRHLNSKRVYPFWKICLYCGNPFAAKTREQAVRNKTCSAICGGKLARKNYPTLKKQNPICLVCKKEFIPKSRIAKSKAKTCGYSCRDIHRLRNGLAERLKEISPLGVVASNLPENKKKKGTIGSKNPSWKGGITFKRNKGNYIGPKYVKCPKYFLIMSRKDGYVLEHRLVVAMHLNRYLTRTEAVHHINHLTGWR